MKAKLSIEIWSDIVCPFCYIGKSQFEKALNEFTHQDEIQIQYKSFQLDPQVTTRLDKSVYEDLAAKKGMSVENIKTMTEQIGQLAQNEGLIMNFDKTKVVNTQRAHELLQFANTQGKGSEVKTSLFEAYFRDGLNVDDLDVLVQIALKNNLPEEPTRKALENASFRNEVHSNMAQAQQLGISGVPFLVLLGKYGISGAQGKETFKVALEQVYQEWKTEQISITDIPTSSENSCEIDNPNC